MKPASINESGASGHWTIGRSGHREGKSSPGGEGDCLPTLVVAGTAVVIVAAMVLMLFAAAVVVMMPMGAGIVAAVVGGVSAGIGTRCGAVIARASGQKKRGGDCETSKYKSNRP